MSKKWHLDASSYKAFWGVHSFILGSLMVPLPVSVHYASPMGDENRRMSGNRLRCGLLLTVPDYGVAYFEQYAARPSHFILSKWQQVERQLPAVVFAAPPVWKSGGNSYLIARTSVKPGEYGLYLPRDPAIKLLTYLVQGY